MDKLIWGNLCVNYISGDIHSLMLAINVNTYLISDYELRHEDEMNVS